MKIEEIQIPVPWGHIAARNWGDQNNEAVIVSHGFQDNAASFDRLIPLLPIHFYYISIDLPGHGLSSSYQQAGSIHYLDFLLTYKLVADYYKRAKYVLMGHSFGGTLSVLFAQLYPTLVSKLVIIDAIYYMPVDPLMFLGMLKNTHKVYFKNMGEKLENRRSYDYDEIVNKIVESRYNGRLTYETGDILAKRMVKRISNGKYVMTLDPNLKGLVLPNATVDYFIEFFKIYPVRCPVLMLLTPNNDFNDRNSRLLEKFEEAGFLIKMIDDQHFVHLTNPELLSTDTSNFLINKRNKL